MEMAEHLFDDKRIDGENAEVPKDCEPMRAGEVKRRGQAKAQRVQIDGKVSEALRKRYIAFDTETTGLNPASDRIIEVGAVLFENGEAVDSYYSLINAGVPISKRASEVNHITNKMISAAPLEEEVYPELIRFMGNALDGETIVCAHNARFDMDFLCHTFSRLGYGSNLQYIDTLTFSRKCVRGLVNYRQDTVARHFGISNRNAHRASADAEVCGRILKELLELEKGKLQRTRIQREPTAE